VLAVVAVVVVGTGVVVETVVPSVETQQIHGKSNAFVKIVCCFQIRISRSNVLTKG